MRNFNRTDVGPPVNRARRVGRLQKQRRKVYDLAPKTFRDCLLFSLKGMDEGNREIKRKNFDIKDLSCESSF